MNKVQLLFCIIRSIALLVICGLLFGVSYTNAGSRFPIPLSAKPTPINDGEIIQVSLGLSQSPQTGTSGTVEVRVGAGNDDAEQEGADGSNPGGMYLTSSDLELVVDAESPTSGAQQVGMRFTGVNVPAGAVITNAHLRFRAIAPDAPNTNNNTANLMLRGQAADNPTTFTSTANEISGRPTTSAATEWTPSVWATGTEYNTPDIRAIVQEIVDRSGWAANQSMVFIITGSGSRSADSYNGSTTTAPLLHIQWRIGGIFLPIISR